MAFTHNNIIKGISLIPQSNIYVGQTTLEHSNKHITYMYNISQTQRSKNRFIQFKHKPRHKFRLETTNDKTISCNRLNLACQNKSFTLGFNNNKANVPK